jgi:general secretion pathway protein G
MQSKTSYARSFDKANGFTLVELMLALIVISILTSVAYSSYSEAVDRARTNTAIADITRMGVVLERFFTDNANYPDTLAEVDNSLDPWGNPYQYLNMSTVKGNGKKRKDRNLVPLNSDYDLYSQGPDGNSVSPLTAAASQDDIIRANNGGFVGKAEDY